MTREAKDPAGLSKLLIDIGPLIVFFVTNFLAPVPGPLKVFVATGAFMAANVWFVIWPNQKKALGLVEADDAAKAKAARTAMLTSRINTLLSIPMLLAMTNFR